MTDQNVEKPELEVVEVEEVIDEGSNSMIWISSLANIASWAILVVMVALVVISIIGALTSGGRLGINLGSFYTVLNWLLLLLVGVSLFLILQFVAKAVFVLLDIQDSTCGDEE